MDRKTKQSLFQIPPLVPNPSIKPHQKRAKKKKGVFNVSILRGLIDGVKGGLGEASRIILNRHKEEDIISLVKQTGNWITEVRKKELDIARKECEGSPPKVVPNHFEAIIHHFLAREGQHRQQLVWGRMEKADRGKYRSFISKNSIGLYILGRARDLAGIRTSLPGSELPHPASSVEVFAAMVFYHALMENFEDARNLERVLKGDGITFQDLEELAASIEMGDNYARIGKPQQKKLKKIRNLSVEVRKENKERRVQQVLVADSEILKNNPGMSKFRRAQIIKANIVLDVTIRTIRSYL